MSCNDQNMKTIGKGTKIIGFDIPEIKADMCPKELPIPPIHLGEINLGEYSLGSISIPGYRRSFGRLGSISIPGYEHDFGTINVKHDFGSVDIPDIKFDFPCLYTRNCRNNVVLKICIPKDLTEQMRQKIYECVAHSAEEVLLSIKDENNSSSNLQKSFGKSFTDCMIDNALPYVLENINVDFVIEKEDSCDWKKIF